MSERFKRAKLLWMEHSSGIWANTPADWKQRKYLHKDGKGDELVPVPVLQTDQKIIEIMSDESTIEIKNHQDSEYWLQILKQRLTEIEEWFAEVQHYLNLDLNLDIPEDDLINLIEKHKEEWQYIQLYVLPEVRELNRKFAKQKNDEVRKQREKRVKKMLRGFH